MPEQQPPPVRGPRHAWRIFEILRQCALDKHTITYGAIGKQTGLNPQNVRHPLDEIGLFCRSRGLPLIDVLVVRGDNRRPGWNWFAEVKDQAGRPITVDRETLWQALVMQVFAYDWSRVEFEERPE